MNIIWKISLRNLWRHKGKSLVIGAILFLGALIMTLGNGAINGLVKNTDRNMVQNVSGDIILVSTNQLEDNVFTGMPKPLKVLSDFRGLEAYLESRPEIEKSLPMCYGLAMLLTGGDHPNMVAYFGVDIEAYQEFFPGNIQIVEGRKLQKGERGVLLNHLYRERFYDNTGVWPVSEDSGLVVSNLLGQAYSNREGILTTNKVVIMGISESGSMKDIRLPFVGIYEFSSINQSLAELNFVDIESFREAFGLITAQDRLAVVSEENQELLDLDTENLDDLFSDQELVGTVKTADTSLKKGALRVEKQQGQDSLDWKEGSFHFITIKLKPGVNRERFLMELNQDLRAKKLDARGIIWSRALGQIGSFSVFMRMALLVFVLFIYFVAAIVIMNTLSMNAIERTSEIGMMRAVGAQKKVIGNMFLTETALLSALFGGAGIVLGTVIVFILGALNIKAPNEITQMLFGGDYFNPIIDLAAFLQGILMLGLVTLLAVIYPIRVARRITPLEAISRE